MDTREIVLDVLLELERGKEYSNRLIRSVLDKYDYLPRQDKAFVKRLTEGVLERGLELDYILNLFSKTPVEKMKPLIRCLLRMGVYQICYMDNVPDAAACNEAVKLAGRKGFRNLKGFVNGVLRSVSREKGRIPYPDPEKEPVRFLSVKYSVPEFLAGLWLEEYGREETESLLAALLGVRPVSIRFRTSLGEEERKAYLARMEEQGVKAVPSPYLDCAWELTGLEGVQSLPGFREGAFTVQDVSSMLAVEAAGIGPEDFVLDVCAAPGGKSLFAAEKAARVLARDVSAPKLELLRENIARMGAENISLQEWDATGTDETMLETADVVLLDVPCSGLGVLGKKRDIKYHVTEESFRKLEELQKQIVEHSWRYVKPGGILLYSTCTIRWEENEEMCRFLCEHYPFDLESMEPFLPEPLAERGLAGYLQLLPGKDACDGFFFARLRRRA